MIIKKPRTIKVFQYKTGIEDAVFKGTVVRTPFVQIMGFFGGDNEDDHGFHEYESVMIEPGSISEDEYHISLVDKNKMYLPITGELPKDIRLG